LERCGEKGFTEVINNFNEIRMTVFPIDVVNVVNDLKNGEDCLTVVKSYTFSRLVWVALQS